MDSILSSNNEGEAVRCLPVGDAQTFINMIDEVRSTVARRHKLTY